MGSITESFANLSEHLAEEYKKSKKRAAQVNLVISKILKPCLPAGTRLSSGILADIKDRQVGPFDIIGTTDNFPPFGDGQASVTMADGALFVLQVRDWTESDLTHFGEMALHIKQLEKKKKSLIPCFAVSFEMLSLPELHQFLKSKAGEPVDGILCIGHHIVIRNSLGWYGNPTRMPFVTEQPGPEALKAFSFFLLQLAQTAAGLPFGLADYQHL